MSQTEHRVTLEVARMPQQTQVRGPDDDWTGLTDTAERRKRQNRLNQRLYSTLLQTITGRIIDRKFS